MLSWRLTSLGLSLVSAANAATESGEGGGEACSWSWVTEISICWLSELCSGCDIPLSASSSTSAADSSASKAWWIKTRDICAVECNGNMFGPFTRAGLINETLKAQYPWTFVTLIASLAVKVLCCSDGNKMWNPFEVLAKTCFWHSHMQHASIIADSDCNIKYKWKPQSYYTISYSFWPTSCGICSSLTRSSSVGGSFSGKGGAATTKLSST